MDIGIIQRIATILRTELPGKAFQDKKAPSTRDHSFASKTSIPRDSSVMLLLYPRDNELFTVYIKRQADGGPHSSQVSFPGGKHDKSDTSLEATALRETEEEIGVRKTEIDVLGGLTHLYIPVSNMMVHPYVGFCNFTPSFDPCPNEVQYIIEVKLDEIINPINTTTLKMHRYGVDISTPLYLFGNDEIWGATAMITSEFEEILRRVIV